MHPYKLQDGVKTAVNWQIDERITWCEQWARRSTTIIKLVSFIEFPGHRSPARLSKDFFLNSTIAYIGSNLTDIVLDAHVATCFWLTESLAFLRSCSSSSIAAAGSITSFSKHAEPREELFCWYMISCDTGILGLPCIVNSGLLPAAPEAAPRGCSRGCPPPLVPGSVSPPRDLSPSKGAGVEQHRFGWDDEKTRSNCFFFLLNIHNPDSFLLPSAPPVPRRSDPSLGLSQGLVFSWKFFHIFRW